MAKIGALHKSYSKVKPGKRLPKQLPVISKKKKPKHNVESDTGHSETENSVDITVGSLLKNPFKQSTLIDPNQVQKGVSALLNAVKKTEEKEQALFSEDKPIFLQIVCMKVPQTPVRFIRILLPNSPFSSEAEVCLIVSDVKKNGPIDDEETVTFYENVLAQKGVTNIKTIIPLHQLKTEYNMYESVRRLVDLYDVFLVEGKISGKVAHILGKIFISKRKSPTPIKIKGDSLCAQISCALNKSLLHIHSKGDSFTMQVGNTSMNEENMKENVIAAIEGLATEFPGGWENISTLYLKTTTSISIPIYINLSKKQKRSESTNCETQET
ncbi:ribosomal L1 domain-containing protein 1 [Agrilus planipennis]|uniref:Ribosomal L1 domain-containing protein 1 n=1 Tax=Agrilus planipennis TaxID=224129 RepID=A0A1W4XBI0_AGRPL|nr:ribosomal L1 domain-containing protein 1 [Agrilus planipennis]